MVDSSRSMVCSEQSEETGLIQHSDPKRFGKG